MSEVKSLVTPTVVPADCTVLAVQAFKGLQLEPPTRDVIDFDDDAEPITKQEEVVTKKKTELTTTRQIETRVKRQVVLEDGKVVQDSGPIVETNTTEDTDKQESETTERRNLGDDAVDGPPAIENNGTAVGTLAANVGGGLVSNIHSATSASRSDGLVREVKTNKVISREEIEERLETEDVQHLGDFSDEAYVKAVNSGKNIQSELLSPGAQRQLVPVGPRILHQSTKAHKTVDTEDTELKCLAQPDGTLVTEKKKTTEHEEIFDEDLPEKDDISTDSRERIDHQESSQRFHKQRDEQVVEYVADGKVIGKEVRYAAETEQMDRDGPPENPSDWDSLSDRVRKARRQQKTLLQQHKEALLADRKDALTERPLDFDKEEKTRKGETMKWLESHFGSESRSSRDSRDEDVEPTKKTFFNVTIKSNPTTPVSTAPKIFPSVEYSSAALSSPSKVVIPERESAVQSGKTTYFQGISEWAERKDSTPKNAPSRSFQEELNGTLERNRLKHTKSREDLLHSRHVSKDDFPRKKDDLYKLNSKTDQKYGSRSDLKYSRDARRSSDEYRQLKTQKEDLGYLSGSRNDVRPRANSRDDIYAKSKKQNGYLHREDSGYVKDSREDVRYYKSHGREDSFIRDSGEDEHKSNKATIQRDDSAYVSSSTYFTAPRSPKSPKIRTPDSGIRSPSPENYDSEGVRPTVPQRKRVLEKKLRQSQAMYGSQQKLQEPPPDYSPTSRSRSVSPPAPSYIQHQQNGVNKKYQRTRFASETPRPSSQTLQRHAQGPPPAITTKSSNKVSSVIGNSLRKLVGKIRSVSAERKMKMKTKRSPSPQKSFANAATTMSNGTSTYQQYNVIDAHIGQQQQPPPAPPPPPSSQKSQQHQQQANRESSVASSSRRERTLDRRGSSDIDMASPKQKYYLGEDPYGGSIYGKENKYDGVRPQRLHSRRQRSEEADVYIPSRSLHTTISATNNNNRTTSANTLGRFSKSTNRLTSAPPSSAQHDYRSTQTLPRKMDHFKSPSQQKHSSSTINVSIVNSVKQQQQQQQQSQPPLSSSAMITQNTGPAKPARSYKALNRSKSFNVHGLNGTNDPSPIYIEKLSNHPMHNSVLYKSNPHLSEEKPQLKSPSIVNLISRSQRDLTKIDEDDGYTQQQYTNGTEKRSSGYGYHHNGNNSDKRNVFLRGLQDQAPELFKTLHGDEDIRNEPLNTIHKYSVDRNGNRERESSLGSRSPVTINKDTASIVRRGSSSTEDYSETYKITSKSDDPQRPSITNTVHSFTKKTVPTKHGRGVETIESSERKSVTTSRYNGEPVSSLRYIEADRAGDGRRGSTGPVVIEVRNRK